MTVGSRPTVALAVICHDRPDELAEALASAAGDGWDEVVVMDMASEPPIPPVDGTTWLRSDVNVGVAAGRNRLLEEVGGDVVVFLDDDAVFLTPACETVRARFAAEPDLAVLAFLVRRPGGIVASEEHPFRGPPRHVDTPRPCAYFVGCAYAARRAALAAVGGYDEEFFYSTEEVDVGLRLVREGWTLQYEPALVVEHRPSSRGRSVLPRVPALRLRNRIVLARRHLPVPLAVPHVAAWAARTLLEASRIPGGTAAWRRAWGQGLRQPVERRPLGWRQLLAVHRRGGRVLW